MEVTKMAHELENMFYMGDAPWHQLGTKVDKAPTVEEAIKLAGLDWTVSLKPLFMGDQRQVEAFATVRDSDNSILGVVGPEYKPLQNAKAFDFFNPFIQSQQATFETAGSLRDGKRIWILAKINREDSVIVPQSDDRVMKYLLLSNSHDGTLAIRVGFTPIRVVCNNTLTLAHNTGASRLIKLKHRGKVEETLKAVQEVINLADKSFEATAEQYRLLASKQIDLKTLEQYVKIVFAQKKSENAIHVERAQPENDSRVLNKIVPLFERGRGNDMAGVKGTFWAAYNSIAEHVQYERGNQNTTSASRLDATWFGTGAALNKRALDTALELVKAA